MYPDLPMSLHSQLYSLVDLQASFSLHLSSRFFFYDLNNILRVVTLNCLAYIHCQQANNPVTVRHYPIRRLIVSIKKGLDCVGTGLIR
jgi:hypothetical protein